MQESALTNTFYSSHFFCAFYALVQFLHGITPCTVVLCQKLCLFTGLVQSSLKIKSHIC